MAARRREDLDAAAHDAGPSARAFVCDVTDEVALGRMVADAAAWLGGLDTVVYAAGTAPLAPLSATTGDQWRAVLATNVTGAALTVAAALGHLRRGTHPSVVLLTSHSVGRPWPGLVPYVASKAALDQLALGLAVEEPALRVLRVVVGNTATGFADRWEPAAAGAALQQWVDEGYLTHRVLEPDEVASAVVAALVEGAAGDLRVVGESMPG
jgi:NAD(P)-dependent dehydrogenase (short-subunit alcohol dehydrogenase family)